MKVTKEIELDRNEEDNLNLFGKCPFCESLLNKCEMQTCAEDFTMGVDGKWKSVERFVEEVDHLTYRCTNERCDFKYDHPC